MRGVSCALILAAPPRRLLGAALLAALGLGQRALDIRLEVRAEEVLAGRGGGAGVYCSRRRPFGSQDFAPAVPTYVPAVLRYDLRQCGPSRAHGEHHDSVAACGPRLSGASLGGAPGSPPRVQGA